MNIQNPTNILQQSKSNIVTNPFIPNEQREIELRVLDYQANKIIEEAYKKNKTTSGISSLTINDINKNVSSSTIGFLDDMFKKPENTLWGDYLQEIIQKEQRFAYLGVLLILIALYMLVTR